MNDHTPMCVNVMCTWFIHISVSMLCNMIHRMIESRFESGNLYRATQIGPYTYNLELRSDITTHHHIQWYYFKIENVKKRKYRFCIINMMKVRWK